MTPMIVSVIVNVADAVDRCHFVASWKCWPAVGFAIDKNQKMTLHDTIFITFDPPMSLFGSWWLFVQFCC